MINLTYVVPLGLWSVVTRSDYTHCAPLERKLEFIGFNSKLMDFQC